MWLACRSPLGERLKAPRQPSQLYYKRNYLFGALQTFQASLRLQALINGAVKAVAFLLLWQIEPLFLERTLCNWNS